MIDSFYGKIFMILAFVVGVLGVIIAFSTPYPNFALLELALEGAGGLFILGLIIHFVGDKPVHCISCGYKLSTDSYYCPNCYAKTPKHYHQKVHCKRCFRRTRYDKYGGKCKYCGTPLKLE